MTTSPSTVSTVSTIGEAMVVLLPESQLPVAEAREYRTGVGGAEFNVASSLARLGVPTHWISRLGDDGFGDYVLDTARHDGVLVDAVERDDTRPTGLYVKETVVAEDGDRRPRMHYYRSGSAASVLGPATLHHATTRTAIGASAIVHTTGITPALSASTAELVGGLSAALAPGAVLSVDLNFRPRLWEGRSTAPLHRLLDQASVLFLGVDEAELFFGHADAGRLFAELPALRRIVRKDEANVATTIHRDDQAAGTEVRSLAVDVVETVGAGDAFAAGYLAGLATGFTDAACTRLGHAVAASTLICHGDRPELVPDTDGISTIVEADEAQWASWRISPDIPLPWTTATAQGMIDA
ncbi:sugar kinase [Plantibacter sp. RU18]|uniref:sugar kinase n=1 Tax=Plantibacter sp. RU18 TaxID=3158143 RepID=UPI003D364A43